jgi:hypothetical protein
MTETYAIITLFFLTVLQNACFTFLSRARNSGSVFYGGFAALFSNGAYILVLGNIIQRITSLPMQITYVVGATTGSMLMHWFSMRYLERGKRKIQ